MNNSCQNYTRYNNHNQKNRHHRKIERTLALSPRSEIRCQNNTNYNSRQDLREQQELNIKKAGSQTSITITTEVDKNTDQKTTTIKIFESSSKSSNEDLMCEDEDSLETEFNQNLSFRDRRNHH